MVRKKLILLPVVVCIFDLFSSFAGEEGVLFSRFSRDDFSAILQLHHEIVKKVESASLSRKGHDVRKAITKFKEKKNVNRELVGLFLEMYYYYLVEDYEGFEVARIRDSKVHERIPEAHYLWIRVLEEVWKKEHRPETYRDLLDETARFWKRGDVSERLQDEVFKIRENRIVLRAATAHIQGRTTDAQNQIEKYIKSVQIMRRSKISTDLYIVLGQCHSKQRSYDVAIKAFKLARDHPNASYYLMDVFRKKSMTDSTFSDSVIYYAGKQLREGRDQRFMNTAGLLLADYTYSERNFDDAIGYYKRVMESTEVDSQAYFRLGIAYLSKGKEHYSLAREQLLEAERKKVYDAKFYLAVVEYKLENYSKALTYLENFEKHSMDPTLLNDAKQLKLQIDKIASRAPTDQSKSSRRFRESELPSRAVFEDLAQTKQRQSISPIPGPLFVGNRYVNIREKPYANENSRIIAIAYWGTSLDGLEYSPDRKWIRVKHGKQYGWIYRSLIRKGLLAHTPDFKISAFKHGVLILHFWALWCKPCVLELPKFNGFFEKISQSKNPNVQVISINLDGDDLLVREYMRKKGYSFPVVRDIEDALFKKNVPEQIVPITLIYNKGKLVKTIKGENKGWDKKEFMVYLQSLK